MKFGHFLSLFTILYSLFLTSCATEIPKASTKEWADCNAWAALVPQVERDKIVQETYTHTSWGEKKKVAYMTLQFRNIAAKEQARQKRLEDTGQEGGHRGQSATQPATQSGEPASRPASRPAHLQTTRPERRP